MGGGEFGGGGNKEVAAAGAMRGRQRRRERKGDVRRTRRGARHIKVEVTLLLEEAPRESVQRNLLIWRTSTFGTLRILICFSARTFALPQPAHSYAASPWST
jgi:hypothetical protein